MGSDLQVDQLLGDLWVARVRGGACSTLLWALSFLPAPQGPTLTSSRCSSLSSTSEGSSVLMLVAQAGLAPGTPGSQSSVSGRTWGGTTTHPPGGSQATPMEPPAIHPHTPRLAELEELSPWPGSDPEHGCLHSAWPLRGQGRPPTPWQKQQRIGKTHIFSGPRWDPWPGAWGCHTLHIQKDLWLPQA